MKNIKRCMCGLYLLMIVIAVAFVTGCEDASTESGQITLVPGGITVTNDRITVITFRAGDVSDDPDTVFVSTNFFYPLEWSVSDPSLGNIISSSAASAIYQTVAGRSGANVVTVRDQIGQIGQAAVVLTFPKPPEESAEF